MKNQQSSDTQKEDKIKIFDIAGKSAIITGAGRGIGRSVALGLARAGADIGLVAGTFFIETELAQKFLADPLFRKYALSKNLLKRFGTPDDVVGAVLYLSSPASALVTGHVLMVDAGWTCH